VSPSAEILVERVAIFQTPLQDIQLHGFALLMILGVSQRFLPGMLGLGQVPAGRSLFLLGLLNAGLLAEVVGFLGLRITRSPGWAVLLSAGGKPAARPLLPGLLPGESRPPPPLGRLLRLRKGSKRIQNPQRPSIQPSKTTSTRSAQLPRKTTSRRPDLPLRLLVACRPRGPCSMAPQSGVWGSSCSDLPVDAWSGPTYLARSLSSAPDRASPTIERHWTPSGVLIRRGLQRDGKNAYLRPSACLRPRRPAPQLATDGVDGALGTL